MEHPFDSWIQFLRRHRSAIGAAAIGLALGFGCRTVSPAAPPEPPPEAASQLSIQDREDGRRLYITKCARCHKFYDPAKYPDADWRSWMEKMSRKAKLKPDQEELLSRYLETFRAGSRTNANTPALPSGPPPTKSL